MLLRQRLYQIAAGYEDQNGSDPLLKAVLERLTKSPFDLASQPTISWLENALIPKPTHRPGPRRTLRARAGQRRRPPSECVLLDFAAAETQPTASRRAPPTTERRLQCLPHLRHPLLVYHHHLHTLVQGYEDGDDRIWGSQDRWTGSWWKATAIGFSERLVETLSSESSDNRTIGEEQRGLMSYIGSSVPRVEDARLVSGEGCYVADIPMPGCLEAAFVRSSVAHGKLRGVQLDAAREVPGVAG